MSTSLCKPAASRSSARVPCRRWASMLAMLVLGSCFGRAVLAQGQLPPPSIVHMVQTSSDRVNMTIHSSRLLTLDQKIPRAQVNNPDLLDLTPISARQVQIYAKKAGITQVNLWDEKGNVHLIDVVIEGDVRELATVLRKQFPNATIKVDPNNASVILSGYIDRPDHLSKIVRIAEEYYPKVINNITVGGAQQVLLHVKVMEVSRTKLRQLGFDFAQMSTGDFWASSIGGALTKQSTTTNILRNSPAQFSTTGLETMQFGVLDQNGAFFSFIQALAKNQLIKTLAEPTLVTVSGRPAYFLAGGSLPYPIPSGLGTTSIAFKPYGVQLDFVPIVLGNGNVRLEVRPSVSEIDPTVAITINGTTVPGFTNREAETGVEMRFGQTLGLAGLISTRLESSKQQIPWIGDLPLVGTFFRSVNETMNEIDLLIMVRPELAEAMDCNEVPLRGPGENSDSGTDSDLYIRGYIEVPPTKPGPPQRPDPTLTFGGQPSGWGPPTTLQGTPGSAPMPPPGEYIQPGPVPPGALELPTPPPGSSSSVRRQPEVVASNPATPRTSPPASASRGNAAPASGAVSKSAAPAGAAARPGSGQTPAAGGAPSTGGGRTPAANAVYSRSTGSNPYNPTKTQNQPPAAKNPSPDPPGFLGSTGYDVTK